MSDTNEVDKKLRDSLSLMIEAGIVEVVEGGYRIAPAFQNHTKAELMAIIEKGGEMTNDEELNVLRTLIEERRLVATIDLDGLPFHFVTSVTLRQFPPDEHDPDVLILWLDPHGVGHDLGTPMDYSADDAGAPRKP